MNSTGLLDDWSKSSPRDEKNGASTFVNPLQERPVVAVAAVGEAEGSRGAAAALACAGADADVATLLIDIGGRPPRPTLLASAAAQKLEEGLAAAAAAVTVARGGIAVVHVPPPFLQAALADAAGLRPSGVLLRADLAVDRPLLALTVHDLIVRGFAVGVLKRRLSWVAERRALFGALPADSPGGLPRRLVRRLGIAQ